MTQLIDRQDHTHVFRLHKDRVYYMSEHLLKKAECVARKNLICCGTQFGKFTHTKKFRLTITCLDYLARLARYKVWVKSNGEQSFLYGNHIVKAHLRRMTEDTPQNAGVVIFSEGDVPLGFGAAARTTDGCRTAGTEQIVVYHQADIGEYLREEADLV
eukprot:CAMPEP_0204267420 /NCGR_PEP_ID=MMETSP0468-20130131/10946_1 /ASSEMBLY_ACC=CAM_ASM_000383 /TAXON_ID=2969 /ORGANISM="Oxyrrhis marina" /LENGTH=157 /DNA_ID=CAMNT_0051242587 /DNA_START=103 /DNA_END=576 /DNA_ORIENTATION=-